MQDLLRPRVSSTMSSARLFWEIVAFVIPAYTFVLLGTLMSAVDKAFVGRLSSLQLASLGPATGAYDGLAFSLTFLGSATLALLGRPPADVKREVVRANALVFAATAGLTLGTFLMLFAIPIVRLFGASDEMMPSAVSYLRVRALCMFIGRSRDVANQFCLAEKDAITPFLSTVVALVVNIVGDILLCERYGTLGAALATDTASAAAMGFVATRLRHHNLWPRHTRLPSREDFAPFAEYAGPIFLNNLSKMGAVMMMGTFATRLGTAPGAAHQICISAWLLCGFALGMPLNWATRAFLPEREDPDYMRTFKVLLAVTATASAMGMGMTLALLTRGLIWFTHDPMVEEEVAGAIPFVAFNIMICVYYQSMEGILITQKRLYVLVRMGAALTGIFCFASCVVYYLGSMTLPLLWATLSAGVFGVCIATTCIVAGGLKTAALP